MREKVTIEPLLTRHLPAVQKIESDLFDTPWTEGMFRQEIEDNHISRPLVALLDGDVVGYIMPWFLPDQVHLLTIAVAPKHQRSGIGRRMLACLVNHARERRRENIVLEVRAGNTAALALYESYGFKRVNLRRNYYPDSGEDAVVMVLWIEGNAAEATP